MTRKKASLRGKTIKDVITGEEWKVVRTRRQYAYLARVKSGPFPSQMVVTKTQITKRFKEVQGGTNG